MNPKALAIPAAWLGVCVLTGVGSFVLALVLRRSELYLGNGMAVLQLGVALACGVRAGSAMAGRLQKDGRSGGLAAAAGTGLGIAVFGAGVVLALLVGLAGSPGGLTH